MAYLIEQASNVPVFLTRKFKSNDGLFKQVQPNMCKKGRENTTCGKAEHVFRFLLVGKYAVNVLFLVQITACTKCTFCRNVALIFHSQSVLFCKERM